MLEIVERFGRGVVTNFYCAGCCAGEDGAHSAGLDRGYQEAQLEFGLVMATFFFFSPVAVAMLVIGLRSWTC